MLVSMLASIFKPSPRSGKHYLDRSLLHSERPRPIITRRDIVAISSAPRVRMECSCAAPRNFPFFFLRTVISLPTFRETRQAIVVLILILILDSDKRLTYRCGHDRPMMSPPDSISLPSGCQSWQSSQSRLGFRLSHLRCRKHYGVPTNFASTVGGASKCPFQSFAAESAKPSFAVSLWPDTSGWDDIYLSRFQMVTHVWSKPKPETQNFLAQRDREDRFHLKTFLSSATPVNAAS